MAQLPEGSLSPYGAMIFTDTWEWLAIDPFQVVCLVAFKKKHPLHSIPSSDGWVPGVFSQSFSPKNYNEQLKGNSGVVEVRLTSYRLQEN